MQPFSSHQSVSETVCRRLHSRVLYGGKLSRVRRGLQGLQIHACTWWVHKLQKYISERSLIAKVVSHITVHFSPLSEDRAHLRSHLSLLLVHACSIFLSDCFYMSLMMCPTLVGCGLWNEHPWKCRTCMYNCTCMQQHDMCTLLNRCISCTYTHTCTQRVSLHVYVHVLVYTCSCTCTTSVMWYASVQHRHVLVLVYSHMHTCRFPDLAIGVELCLHPWFPLCCCCLYCTSSGLPSYGKYM